MKPENVFNKSSGDTMDLWADCGKSARDVIGAGGGSGYGGMTAAYRRQKPIELAPNPVWYKPWAWHQPAPTVQYESKQTAASDPEGMKKEILMDRLGVSDPDAALAKYQGLPAKNRDLIDQELQIDRYAAPGVGEGYTMSSGGADYPGASTWNFHWAGVVMVSGDDRVTLENYSVSDPKVENHDWIFQMYGSAAKAGQTFHEQHEASHQHGQAPTTMRVQKR